MGGYWDWGADMVLWLQGNAAFLQPLMHALSFLGTTEFLLLLGLTVYWCIDTRTGVRLGLLLVTGAALGGILKLLFHMPRPYWYDVRIQAMAGESTYGLPSMHALYAWSIAPRLGWRVHPRWGLAAGVLLAIGISVSRIYLGVHFVGDVMAGVGFGVLVWFGLEQGIRFAGPILARSGFLMQCIAVFLTSMLLLIAQAAILRDLDSTPDPAVWAENAARINLIFPRDPGPLISLAGLILGMGVGLACQNRWAPFRAAGTIEKRILRFLLGISVAMFLLGGSAILGSQIGQPMDMILRYVSYSLVGLWVIFLAPWLFLRWKLADRAG